MDYIETYDNTIYYDEHTEEIDDITLFYFIFTVPNFKKNAYVIKRIKMFIDNYKKLNGYTM